MRFSRRATMLAIGIGSLLWSLHAGGSQSPGFGTVQGRVTSKGFPCPGARVVLLPYRVTGAIVTSPRGWLARTDDSGSFALRGLPPGDYRCTIATAGLAPAVVDVTVPGEGETRDVNLDLTSGLTLEGRLICGDDPVSGVSVELWIDIARTEFSRKGKPLGRAASDVTGRFSFEAVPVGLPLLVVVRSANHRPLEARVSDAAHVPLLSLSLDPGSSVSGRVMDTAGAPVVEAVVQAAQGEGYVQETRTDGRGEFVIGGLAGRPGILIVRRTGLVTAKVEFTPGAAGMSVTLPRGGGLAGRVSGGDGPAFLVLRRGREVYRRPFSGSGPFRWEGLPPGPARLSLEDATGTVQADLPVHVPEGRTVEDIDLRWGSAR